MRFGNCAISNVCQDTLNGLMVAEFCCVGLKSILKLRMVTIDLYYFKALHFFFKREITSAVITKLDITKLRRFYSEESKRNHQ